MRLMFFLFVAIGLGCKVPKGRIDSYKFTKSAVYGRSYMMDDKVALVTTAAHTGIKFDGNKLTLMASASKNGSAMLQYTLDGILHQQRIMISGDQPQPIEIIAAKGRHTLWLYKCTEALSGPLFLHNVQGINISPTSKQKSRKIEFIGNSITCAAAADTIDAPCGAKPYEWYHNGYMSYAAQVARKLDVDYTLNSVSGAGIYRNWNSDGPTVPQLYDFVNLTESSPKMEHKLSSSPDIISIALGTNDFSNGDGIQERKPFDEKAFISKYIEFVQRLKSIHPKAKIALIDSPMIEGDTKNKLNAHLLTVKSTIDKSFPNDQAIAIYTFKKAYRSGCSTHPSVAEHTLMAEEIRQFYSGLLSGK